MHAGRLSRLLRSSFRTFGPVIVWSISAADRLGDRRVRRRRRSQRHGHRCRPRSRSRASSVGPRRHPPLPFADGSFDAIFICAVLQQVADPLRPLMEARRIARPGAVIGVADADWGSALSLPTTDGSQRGQEILSQLQRASSPYVGRHLRGLLHAAGFVEVQVTGVAPGAAARLRRRGRVSGIVLRRHRRHRPGH